MTKDRSVIQKMVDDVVEDAKIWIAKNHPEYDDEDGRKTIDVYIAGMKMGIDIIFRAFGSSYISEK